MAGINLGILLVPLAVALAPLLARALRPVARVHVVVFELFLGMIAGPQVLGWIQPSQLLSTLSSFGMVMLFFMAGSHIELAPLRRRTGLMAAIGWATSLLAGGAAAWFFLPRAGFGYVAVALCSTALGALMPILRDAGELGSPFGHGIAAVGAVGEFGPLLIMSLFLSGRDVAVAAIVLGIFAAAATILVWSALRAPAGALHRVVSSTMHTSDQFAIRVLMVIMGLLVLLSLALRLDTLLGAFMAGILWRLLMREAPERDRAAVESKVEGIAYGFLIPIFFVATGVAFDLRSLTTRPLLLLGAPVAALALLVFRGTPSMLAAPAGSSLRDRGAFAFFGATGLPIVVAATSAGVASHMLTASTAAMLVGAAVLSLLLFPAIGAALRTGAARGLSRGPSRPPAQEAGTSAT